MAETQPHTQDIEPSTQSTRPKRKTTHQKRGQLVTCGICGARMATLTRRHLQAHGLTPAVYGRVYGTPTPKPLTRAHDIDESISPDTHGQTSGVPLQLIGQLADAMVESPEFLNRLATDVGQHLLYGRTRGLLAAALGATIATRVRQAGDAAARLAQVNRELAEPWRLEQGGEDGGPTPTRDVIAMHTAAAAELDRASDAILRAGKLAIDERRGQSGEAAGDAPLDRYTGERDALALPDDVGPGERAIMLALLERMASKQLAKRTVIDASAQGSTPVE